MLGEKIKKLREENNLTQSQLAKSLFVSRQAVSLWEQDKTMPSTETLKLIKKLYNISIDDWLVNDFENKDNIIKNNKSIKLKKILACVFAFLLFAVLILESVNLVNNYRILNPKYTENITIIRKEEIINLKTNYGEDLVFQENSKPKIKCSLPNRFIYESTGLYKDEEGNFIRFNSSMEDNVINPLLNTDYYKYYEELGYHSYLDMARKSMYVNIKKVNIFSKKQDIYIAGGAKILRQQFCAGQNASYYEIDGGLNKDNSKSRIYGFALLFDEIVWSITMMDCNNDYYFITIKDNKEIKNSIILVGEFLSTILIDE